MLVALALLLGMACAQQAGQVLDQEIAAFVGGDYVQLDTEALETAVEAALPPSDSVFLASAEVGVLAKALLALEAADGVLERTRHHGTVRVLSTERSPVVFVQVDRYNLGPSLHAELVAELGAEHVAPLEEFGMGQHVSWRFVMHQVMGQEAALLAAARAVIGDAQADAAPCLGKPCLLTSGGIDDNAVWHELEAVDLGPETNTLDLASAAGALDLAASLAFFDPYQVEVDSSDALVAEFVMETGLAQEQVVDVALRQGQLMDDSLAAQWQRLLTLTGWDSAPEAYAAQAFECRRGEGGFAPAGEYCL